MALRRRPPVAQGEDHFLVAVMVPASKKDRLERALGTATDADLGGPVFASFYAPREDFEEEESALQQGRALGRELHRNLTGKN